MMLESNGGEAQEPVTSVPATEEQKQTVEENKPVTDAPPKPVEVQSVSVSFFLP